MADRTLQSYLAWFGSVSFPLGPRQSVEHSGLPSVPANSRGSFEIGRQGMALVRLASARRGDTIKPVVSVRWLVLVWAAGCGRIGFGQGEGGLGDGLGDGGTVDARTTVGAIVMVAQNDIDVACPSLVYDGTTLAVAWRDSRNGSANQEVYFARYALDGSPVGAELRVTTDPANTGCPALMWTGSRYAIVYEDNRVANNYQVFLSNVSATGLKLGGDLQLTTNNGDARGPQATWTGAQIGFVYQAFSGSSNYHMHYALATLAGVTSNDTEIGSMQSVGSTGSVGVTTGGEAVVWYEAGATNMLHYAFITTTPQLNIALTPSNNGAFVGRPGNVLVGSMQAIAYTTGLTFPGSLMLTLVEPATGALSTPRAVVAGYAPSLAWDGAVLGLAAIPGPFFVPLSAIGQPTDAPLPLSSLGVNEPAVVTLPGGGFAVAWDEFDGVTASVRLATRIQPQ